MGEIAPTTDTFILESDAGISYVCPIVNTSSDSFTVRLADGCETGYYKVFVKRDARKKSFGRIYINIVEDIDFKPDAGTTVYGIVSSAGVGVENVVVSDGAEVTVTNERASTSSNRPKVGICLHLRPERLLKFRPSGCSRSSTARSKNSADVVERADFKLERSTDRTPTRSSCWATHLANRTGDLGTVRPVHLRPRTT